MNTLRAKSGDPIKGFKGVHMPRWFSGQVLVFLSFLLMGAAFNVSCAKNSDSASTGATPTPPLVSPEAQAASNPLFKPLTAHAWCTYVRQPKRPVTQERLVLSPNGSSQFTYFRLNMDGTRRNSEKTVNGTWALSANRLTINLGNSPVTATIALVQSKIRRGTLLERSEPSEHIEARFAGNGSENDRPIAYARCD